MLYIVFGNFKKIAVRIIFFLLGYIYILRVFYIILASHLKSSKIEWVINKVTCKI